MPPAAKTGRSVASHTWGTSTMVVSSPTCPPDSLLGIEYPIFQGGMAWISDGKLAAAVSNAGGLGIISAMNADAQYLQEQIAL